MVADWPSRLKEHQFKKGLIASLRSQRFSNLNELYFWKTWALRYAQNNSPGHDE